MKLALCFAVIGLSAAAFGQTSEDVAKVEDLFWQKDYEAAASEARALAEQEVEARYFLALTLVETGKASEAEQQLRAAGEAGLAGDMQKVVEGRLALERKRNPDAQRLLSEAIQANGKNVAAYYYRGLAYAAAGDFPKAVADFEKSIELRPDNFLGHYYAGIANNRIRRPDRMVSHFEQLIKLAPQSEEAQKAQSLLRSVR